MDSSQQQTKLFVGGVARETTEDILREHFGKFGRVEESLIIRDRVTGIGRGFGFVTFSDSSMASEALREEHLILGRKVDVKLANNKSNRQQQQQHLSDHGNNGDSNTQYNTKKIFVGGLPHNLTEEEFKSYFESFGTVVDVVVISDKENHRSRGFGFITFDSEHAVDAVLKNSFHELKNKMVEVKRAEPKDRNCMTYYDCYHAGLGFGRGYHVCYSNYFFPFYVYPAQPPNCSWSHYGFGGPTGGWVTPMTVPVPISSNLTGSSVSHGQLASRNPSANYFSNRDHMNGSTSHHSGNYRQTTDSIPNGGKSNSDAVLVTIRSPLPSSNGNVIIEDQRKDVDDSSTLKKELGSNSNHPKEDQRKDIDGSSTLKSELGLNSNANHPEEYRRREIDDASPLKHQNGEMGAL